MPLPGTCDPASRGAQWNVISESVDGDAVSITYQFGWDGTSVRPDCVGPLNSLTAVNNSAVVYYAHFQGRKGTWQRVQLDPGVTKTYTAQQLKRAGFADNTDLEGLFITTDPNPPIVTLAAKG